MTEDICRGCGRPIVAHEEPRYMGREPDEHWHWSCFQPHRGTLADTNLSDIRAQLATAVENVERAFEKLKAGLRDPQVRTRRKLTDE